METEETGGMRRKPAGLGDGLGVGDDSRNGIRRKHCQGERQRSEEEKGGKGIGNDQWDSIWAIQQRGGPGGMRCLRRPKGWDRRLPRV